MNQNPIIGKRYRLTRELSQNNWSRTYLAEDVTIPESPNFILQAFHLAAEEKVTTQEVKRRYANETYIWQKLASEPEMPRVLACFEEDNVLFLVRDYIPGENLSERLEEPKLLNEYELLEMLRDVLTSLRAIHQQDVIHNDLKPSNIILADKGRRNLIIGFSQIRGIANDSSNTDELTRLIVSNNEYYPEIQPHHKIGPKLDIHALGAIALEAITGNSPSQIPPHFPVKTVLARENSQINYQLIEVIERMMNHQGLGGYDSVELVLDDLNKIRLKTAKPNLAEASLLSKPSPMENLDLSATGIAEPVDQPLPSSSSEGRRLGLKSWYFPVGALALLLLGGLGEFFLPVARPWLNCRQGSQALASELPQEALDKFQRALDLRSQSTCGWQGKAESLYALERYRAALAAYDQVDRLKPNQAKTWQGRGEVLHRLERFEAANTAYDKTLKIAPENAEVWNRKGNALYRLELYQEALAAHDSALRIDQDFSQALNDRGVALIGLGKYEDALKAFNRAQSVDPLDPELWQNKALVLQYLNRPQEARRLFQEAISAYDRVIAENPQNVTALLDKANVLGKLQQHQAALIAFEQAIEINDDSHLAWLGKGNSLFALQRYPEALKAFDRAVKVQPKSYITWHNRGSLLRDGLKDFPEAISSYDKSLAINPNFYHAWRDRGVALSQSGQQEEAIKSFDKAIEISARDHQSWVGRGIALSSQGKTEEAISVFDRAVEIQPLDPFVWMNRGAVLETAQRFTEACDAYREVKKINPTFPPAIQKLQQLSCQS